MGALALELSQVSSTDLCALGIANSQTLILGRRILSDATTEGENAPSSNSGFGLQVDSDCLPLLAE